MIFFQDLAFIRFTFVQALDVLDTSFVSSYLLSIQANIYEYHYYSQSFQFIYHFFMVFIDKISISSLPTFSKFINAFQEMILFTSIYACFIFFLVGIKLKVNPSPYFSLFLLNCPFRSIYLLLTRNYQIYQNSSISWSSNGNS